VDSADADLDASVENYDDVLVTLLADVATTYVEIRTLQRRLDLATANAESQRGTFKLAEVRFKEGAANEIDMQQAKSNMSQTEALVPALDTSLRQATNRLCVLMGMPPEDLMPRLGKKPVPTAPADVALGVPAQMLLRRPDVRRAERQLAAQSERIGIAEAELYPHIAVSGTIGVDANQFKDLFRSGSSFGSVGPSLRWNVLNYGRIVNNVRAQDALFQQLAVTYQQTVLLAGAEAENAIVAFLKSQQRLKTLTEGAAAARRANELVVALYDGKDVGLDRVFDIQNFLVLQEDAQARAEGDVAASLISIYRALGGGWQIRLGGEPARFQELPPAEPGDAPPPKEPAVPMPAVPKPAEPVPAAPEPRP